MGKTEELRGNAQARDHNWPMLDRSRAKMAQDTSDLMPSGQRVNTLNSQLIKCNTDKINDSMAELHMLTNMTSTLINAMKDYQGREKNS